MNSSVRERVVRFGARNSLAGILSTSREARPGLPFVVIVNAGIIHRVGPNRLYVDVARAVAALGYPVLRFDLAGLGDSDVMSSEASLLESAMLDVKAAFDYLTSAHNATTFLAFGLCSGANYAALAAFNEPRVIGVLLIDPTVARTRWSMMVHIGRRLRNLSTLRSLLTLRHPVFQRRGGRTRSVAVARAAEGQSGQRAEPALERLSPDDSRRSLEQLVERAVHLMFVFTGGVNHVYNYRNQLYDLLPGFDFHGLLRLEYMPDTDHTVSDGRGRRQLLESIRAWLTNAFPGGRAPGTAGPAAVEGTHEAVGRAGESS